jgi:hypothetical protein
MAPVPNSLSDVAATLAELKQLPLEQKARLLLGRLAKIGQHNESALNKHNLMLPGDPYALAQGYPESEKLAVREHLFGAPARQGSCCRIKIKEINQRGFEY